MRGIVQYEVYVYEAGRWSLHARYPGVQRADAVKDADTTEFTTGHATKVVRDTYFPDSNENEEVTTYLSPKAKLLRMRRAPRSQEAARPAPPPLVRTAAVHPERARRRPQRNRVYGTVRLVVAIGLSVLVATTLTAALSWVLDHLPAPFALEAGAVGITLTTCYLLAFLFVFPRAFRARLRIHQLLAEMWENADKPSVAPHPPRRVKRAFQAEPSAPWTPPHDRRARAETPVAATPVPPVDAPAVAAPSITAASVPPPPSLSEPEPPPAAEPQPALPADTKPAEKKATPPVAPAAVAEDRPEPFTPVTAPEVPEGLALERIILRRFAVDVVMPSIARAYRDDPVTRRGVALLLAGAVEGLSRDTAMTSQGALALLAEALRESGSRPAAIESFLGSYQGHLAAPNAKALLDAGRAAIAAYVDGRRDVDHDIQQALAVWRFPSTARLVPAKPEFYLFSIAREESLTDGEPSIGLQLHQAVTRAAVAEFGGVEVQHDSAGLLARFEESPAAFAAARAVQSRMIATAGPPTASVIVVGPASDPGVPLETASILERVRALLTVTVDGEIVCDAAVHSALGDPAYAAAPIADRTDAVRIVEPATAA
jgi:hypothetical protein